MYVYIYIYIYIYIYVCGGGRARGRGGLREQDVAGGPDKQTHQSCQNTRSYK